MLVTPLVGLQTNQGICFAEVQFSDSTVLVAMELRHGTLEDYPK